MSETVSIIVSVHNSKRYLRECVDSILTQTYEDLEIILTDDGSTDSSGDICDEYETKDSRVRVIHKSNGGLSSARNAGLKTATGDYVFFADSGDYLIGDCIEKLLSALRSEPEADFAFCDFWDSGKHELSAGTKDGDVTTRVLDLNGFRGFLSDFRSREYADAVVAWNKLFKASFLKKMLFPEGKWHEDEFFVNKILTRMKACVFVPEKLYCYRKNDFGITIARESFDIRSLDIFEAYAGRVQDAARAGDREFALETAVNGFDGLIYLLGEADELMAEGKDIGKILHRKYFEFYKDVFRFLDAGTKVKYFMGLINHRKLLRRR